MPLILVQEAFDMQYFIKILEPVGIGIIWLRKSRVSGIPPKGETPQVNAWSTAHEDQFRYAALWPP
jgi:hypothetical protein